MKKKITLIMFIGSLFTMHLYGQEPVLGFIHNYGDNVDYNYGASIVTDDQGNIFSTGYFSGTVDFDAGASVNSLTSQDSYDAYITKMDNDGNLIWAKSIEGTDYQVGLTIKLDQNGNVIVGGHFQGTTDFDPGVGVSSVTSAGNDDAFILKLDGSGNFQWVYTFENSGVQDEDVKSISIDQNNNIIATGTYTSSIDFDNGAGTAIMTSNGSNEIFILKIDELGNYIWSKSIGGTGSDVGRSITTDESNNIYVTGHFNGTVDFDPNAGVQNIASVGSFDIFALKMDANGNLLWVNTYGSSDYDHAFDINLDSSNNVILAGNYQETVDFDTGTGVENHTSMGNSDMFILKMNNQGDFIWVYTIEGYLIADPSSVVSDANDNIYVTGNFRGTFDFDNSAQNHDLTANGQSDYFLLKINHDGTFNWASSAGGSGYNEGVSVTLDPDNNIFTTGYFVGTADFDFSSNTNNVTANSLSDMFIHKHIQCTQSTGNDFRNTCGPFTWIDGNTYNSSNNTATYLIPGGAASGCDSLVTLDLTITDVDSSVTQSGAQLTANTSGAQYQWLDCDDNYAPIQGATGQSFSPQENGNYAVEVTVNGCADTSSCKMVTNVAVDKNKLSQLLLYPNPNRGTFTIEVESNSVNSRIEIRNVLGAVVYTNNLTQQKTQLHLNHLSDGVYILTVGSRTIKFIKK